MVSKLFAPMTTGSQQSEAHWTSRQHKLSRLLLSSNRRFCPTNYGPGPLPVCLAEHHQGKARRLRLVLAALSHLTKAEISSLQDGPHLPGGTTMHELVYGYAVDASPTPEWLVITDGQQSGRWRLLHNSTGPGQRCSVGCSQRYQPTPNTAEQRKAQDYTFEALHRVYFYDAWRAQPVLNAPGSELVLPPQPGLLVHGCFWPQPSAPEDVLSVSDVATEAGDQSCQTPTSPETADAIMADEEASNIVSVLSSPSEPSTLPSAVLQEEADSPMEDKDGDATSSEEEGDCLSNHPASSTHGQQRRNVGRKRRGKAVLCHHRELIPKMKAPRRIPRSPQSNEDQGQRQVLGGLNPKSSGSQWVRHPSSHLAAFLSMGNSRSR